MPSSWHALMTRHHPVRDAARTMVLSMLNSMGLSYSTWEEAKRDARNIPYHYLAMQFARS